MDFCNDCQKNLCHNQVRLWVILLAKRYRNGLFLPCPGSSKYAWTGHAPGTRALRCCDNALLASLQKGQESQVKMVADLMAHLTADRLRKRAMQSIRQYLRCRRPDPSAFYCVGARGKFHIWFLHRYGGRALTEGGKLWSRVCQTYKETTINIF